MNRSQRKRGELGVLPESRARIVAVLFIDGVVECIDELVAAVPMSRLFAVPAVVVAIAPFHSMIQPLTGAPRAEVKRTAWHQGCPVGLSDLRVLSVSYYG